MPEQPVSGLTVLDLGSYISAPFSTKLLAGMGAEVIKIEPPGFGDPSRRMGPFLNDVPDIEKSGTFLYLNTAKKSITLDIRTATGVAIFKELVKNADAVVENFAPAFMPGEGIGYETLEKINPKLVMTSITPFGQNGPYRDYKGDEMIAFAMGGLMFLMGDADREPLKTGYSAAQYMGGLAGFTGTMAALFYARRTETGQQVDVSLMEGMMSSHPQTFEEHAYTGNIPDRKTRAAGFVYRCKDGIVGFSTQPHQWPRMVQMLGMPELLTDPRFKTPKDRTDHAKELEDKVMPWMMTMTMVEIYEAGQNVGLPTGYVATSKDVLSSQQYKVRDYFIEIEHPVAGKLTYAGAPVKMGDVPWNYARAPLLGEHNDEIYCGRLGYSREEMLRLFERGII